MKLVSKFALGLIVASSFMFVGCYDNASPGQNEVAKPVIDETEIGLRKTDLFSEQQVKPDETQYSESMAGSGHKFKRAFQDAPPMIPHSVEGMLPVQINNNQCVSCHAPEVASSLGALPYPESHMIDFRPKHKFDGQKFEKAVDPMKNEVSIKKISQLSGSRFNCTLCHAPQSKGELVHNNFDPDFTTKDGAEKSHWTGTSLTDGLDTLKE